MAVICWDCGLERIDTNKICNICGAPRERPTRKEEDAANAARTLHKETAAARIFLENYRHVLDGDVQLRADAIEGETNLREAIMEGLRRLAEISALQAGILEMSDDLDARARRLDEQKQTLRVAIATAMEMAELKRLETPIATVSLKRVPPALHIVDEAQIPSKFWVAQDPTLDRSLLKRALKDGDDVPGARLDNGSITIAVLPR